MSEERWKGEEKRAGGWKTEDGGEKPDGVVISHAGYCLMEVFYFFFFPSPLSPSFYLYPTRMVYDEQEQFTTLLFFWTELRYRRC